MGKSRSVLTPVESFETWESRIKAEKLTFKGYFKHNFYYPFRRFISSIQMFPKEVKWFIQRGKRGWSECDAWNLFEYNLKVMGEAMMYLSQKGCGHPVGISSNKWTMLLKTNALRCVIISNSINGTEGLTDFNLAHKELKKLLKFYSKHYFSLWD